MPIDIATVILQWQNAGVYDYVLPFLLVFAIVFGILSATNMVGGQRGLQVIIAVVIGLMAVGYNYNTGLSFSQFLQTLLPKLVIGLAVLLSLLILIGLFIPDDERKYWGYGLGTIGVLIAIVIIAQSFQGFGSYGYLYSSDYFWQIAFAIFLVGIIIAVATSGGKKGDKGNKDGSAKYSLFERRWEIIF